MGDPITATWVGISKYLHRRSEIVAKRLIILHPWSKVAGILVSEEILLSLC